MSDKNTIIDGVHLISLKINTDNRGSLIAVEDDNILEFKIRRVFYMFDMKSGSTRGQHANKYSTMCFLCVKGKCKINVDNGKEKGKIVLDNPAIGLICGPMTWKEIYEFSEDCVLMVICDTIYDKNDYITIYDEFKQSVQYDRL